MLTFGKNLTARLLPLLFSDEYILNKFCSEKDWSNMIIPNLVHYDVDFNALPSQCTKSRLFSCDLGGPEVYTHPLR